MKLSFFHLGPKLIFHYCMWYKCPKQQAEYPFLLLPSICPSLLEWLGDMVGKKVSASASEEF